MSRSHGTGYPAFFRCTTARPRAGDRVITGPERPRNRRMAWLSANVRRMRHVEGWC